MTPLQGIVRWESTGSLADPQIHPEEFQAALVPEAESMTATANGIASQLK